MDSSKFLPNEFSYDSKLAIIAGRGIYPQILFDRAKNFANIYLIALNDETEPVLRDYVQNDKKININIGQIGQLLSFIKKNAINYVVMAGQVQPKKLFHGLNPDLKALLVLSKLAIKNAETIFGAIAEEIGKTGAKVIDARSFMDEDLVSYGNMTNKCYNIKQEYIDHGIMITKEIAKLGIGQAAIFRKGTVLAVEDFAGTNDLIRRAAKFKTDDVFFVKVSKNKQDFRFDVPIFGQQTLDIMAECNIKTAILESDSVIILNKKSTIETANKYGISILGF